MSERTDLIEALESLAFRLSGTDAATVREAADVLSESRKYREHTPQRLLMARLEAAGIDCEPEARVISASLRSKSGFFRADIAVRRNGVRVALCECKSWKRELTGRQREHYESCGLPYIVAGKDNIDEAFNWLVERARG